MDARKTSLDQAAGLKLARSMKTVVACKGKKVTHWDMRKDAPGDAELAKALIGPSGNLRAPALITGDTLVVGFNEESYREYLVAKKG